MELRVLGPLEVRVDGVTLPLGAPKQQGVLALLALSAGRVVPLADLIDELWADRPPASAVENVRSYAANLRRLFDSVEPGRTRLAKSGTGYLLVAGPDELDLLGFEDEVRRAREARQQQDLIAAARHFVAALARWRGDLLAGLKRGPLLDVRCGGIVAEQVAVTEETAELHVAMGDPGRAVGLLREHVHLHPLREHAQALLIRSLHVAGDRAGALSAYTAARTALVDQLGIEPGAELQAAHRAVLRDEAEGGPLGTPHQVVIPHELPAEPGCFVGRTNESDRIGAALVRSTTAAHRRPAVVVVYGQGGVGKSALAVRVAHRVSEHFPDGQLYLDLIGFSPGLEPLSTAEGLERLLRGLGLSQHDAPKTDADAAALWRTLTSDRRLLLVLDNVRDAGQLVPLLPASPACAVLVTSRGPLASVDADLRLGLDSLSTRQGVTLLHQLMGTQVGLATATRIVELCDHLPLAIRIAAGRLIGRPDLSPDELVDRLADHQRRLDELELEGLAVRSCIRVGYDALASGTSSANQIAARAFRMLGLLKVPTVQAEVLSAMLAEPNPATAAAALDRLAGAQLVEPVPGGRYRLHDLVRLVASETAAAEESPRSAELAQRRAMSYFLAHLRSAVDLLRPGRVPFLASTPDLADNGGKFTTPQAAAGWVHDEHLNLMAAAGQASRMPRDGYRFTLWISFLTANVLYIAYEWWRASELGRLVLETAERHGDEEMAAWGHLMVGRSEAELGNDSIACTHFDQALAAFARSNEYGTALTLIAYAILADLTGKAPEAVAYYSRCLEFARARAFSALEGTVCFNLANLHATLGHWDLAKEGLEQAVAIRRSQADRRGIGAALMVLAVVHCRTGEIDLARRYVDDALSLFRDTGDRFRECNALLVISELELRGNGHADASLFAETVLSYARADGNRYAEAAALRQMAKLLAMTGDEVQAEKRYSEAQAAFLRVTSRLDPVLEDLFVETQSLSRSG